MDAQDDLLTTSQLASRMAEPGIPAAPLNQVIRNYAQQGLISPAEYKGTGITAHRRFSEDQWLVATVLRTVHDFGFADFAVLGATSHALNHWTAEENDAPRKSGQTAEEWIAGSFPAKSPAQFVIDEWRRGEKLRKKGLARDPKFPGDWWSFELGLHRHETTGERVVKGRIRNAVTGAGTPFGLGDEYVERALLAIDLPPYISHLLRPRSQVN
jgi:hypothetical protein